METRLTKRQIIKGFAAIVLISSTCWPKAKLAFAESIPSDGMKISSPAFENGGMMPEIYTQESDDISPPLVISGVPKGTVSLALICRDPDAPSPDNPQRTVIHWVVVNLPPDIKEIKAGEKMSSIPGVMEGLNSRGNPRYMGPKPPIGVHRYFFRLYALDTKLAFTNPPTEPEVVNAMKGHIIAEAEVMGRYSLKKNR